MLRLPITVDKVFVIGDIHGNFEYVKYLVNSFHLNNACIFICGDIGIGFNINYETKILSFLKQKLLENNIFVVATRGNHDNPDLFNDTELSNWMNVPDYTVVNVKNQNFLCIGGGISVDRTGRVPYKSYWPNEQVKYQPKVEEQIDVIISHTAPSFCYPNFKGSFVLAWAEQDDTLLKDLDKERKTMDTIYEDYKDTIKYWYYGHFHDSKTEVINQVVFKLLGINEFVEHGRDNNNIL